MYNFHTHTCWSDSKPSIMDWCEYAFSQNYSMIGISDHCDSVPTDHSLHFENIRAYFKAIEEAKKISPIPLFGGLEFNYEIDEKIDKPYYDEIMACKPDFLIGVYHSFNKENNMYNVDYVKQKDELPVLFEDYFHNLITMVNKQEFNMLAHFDLFKKFIKVDESKFYHYYDALTDALLINNVVAEYNTTSGPIENTDPNLTFLKLCAKKEVPVVVSADAHTYDMLGRHFNEAFFNMKKAGVKTTAWFHDGKTEVIEFVGG